MRSSGPPVCLSESDSFLLSSLFNLATNWHHGQNLNRTPIGKCKDFMSSVIDMPGFDQILVILFLSGGILAGRLAVGPVSVNSYPPSARWQESEEQSNAGC